MKIWIVRFISYEGAAIMEGYFRTEKAARKIYDSKRVFAPNLFEFKDDFGVRVRIDPAKCAVVLTNTEASAAFHAALTTANDDAAKTYGITTKIDYGSTIQ